MTPGDTLIGLDAGGHLWVVISSERNGQVAVVNITTHRDESCIDSACHIEAGEHPQVSRRSCVFYRKAFMTSAEILTKALERNIFQRREPLSAALLRRVQEGARTSGFTAHEVKSAVASSINPD